MRFSPGLKAGIASLKSQLLQRSPDSNEAMQTITAILPDTPEVSLPGWLYRQPIYPKLYWSSRIDESASDEFRGETREVEVAGLGVAMVRTGDDARAFLASLAGSDCRKQYYWLSTFDNDTPVLILPRIELLKQQGHFLLRVNAVDRANLSGAVHLPGYTPIPQWMADLRDQDLLSLLSGQFDIPELDIEYERRIDLPNHETWRELVGEAKACISARDFEKVVLARETRVFCAQQTDTMLMAAHWQQSVESCYQFVFQTSSENGFISFSPERLFRRTGCHLDTEALAGTAMRSCDPDQDHELGQQLLLDEKNTREHRLVVEDILEKLGGLSDAVSQSGRGLWKQKHIQHLIYPLRAKLHAGIDDHRILAALHPTAAIAGSPGRVARDFLTLNEPFRRNWYAGTHGCVSALISEIAVSLRAAQIVNNEIKLFSGAGIV
ncbi:MAG: isochorismate synthase, partial [Pseudomonadales bacterium]|nr:isochorismate synthase [Pseudomonadales bacterium]